MSFIIILFLLRKNANENDICIDRIIVNCSAVGRLSYHTGGGQGYSEWRRSNREIYSISKDMKKFEYCIAIAVVAGHFIDVGAMNE